MSRYPMWTAALLAAVAAGAAGAAPSPTPPPDPGDPPAGAAEITVSLAQVPVRVVDRDGRFVSGLGRDDFEVIEDGTPRPVEYVDEYGGAPRAPDADAAPAPGAPADPPPPAPAPGRQDVRSLVLLVDGANSSADSIGRQRDYLRRFSASLEGTNTLVAVFELRDDGVFELRSGFTRDTAATAAAIQRLHIGGGGAQERTSRLREMETMLEERIRTCTRTGGACMDSAFRRVIDTAERHAAAERIRAGNALDSLRSIASIAGNLPGTRSIVLVSEGIDAGGLSYYNAAAKLLRYHAQNTAAGDLQPWISEVQRAAQVRSSDLPKLAEVIDAALAAGVTVHWINPGHDLGSAFAPDSALGSHSVGTSDVGVPDGLEQMASLARETGGLSLPRAAGLDGFYERLRQDLSRYYVVSFTPARDHHDGAAHDVKVKVKRRDVSVRAPGSYTDHLPEQRVARRLGSALDFPDVFADFAMPSDVTWLLDGDGRYRIRIRLAVPYRELAPSVRGDTASDVLHFGFALRDAEGKVVASEHRLLSVREPFARFEELSRSGALIEYEYVLAAEPGGHTLTAAALVAGADRTATLRRELALPPPSARCLHATPLMLARSAEPAPEPVPELVFDDSGAAHLGRHVLRFSAVRELPQTGRLEGIYQIVHAAAGADGKPLVDLFFRLFRGGTFVNQTSPTRLDSFTSGRTIVSYFAVPYSRLEPGEHRLEIVARDAKTGCESIGAADFTVLRSRPAAQSGPGGHP